MPRYFGRTSSYLLKNDLKNYALSLAFVVLPLAVILIFYRLLPQWLILVLALLSLVFVLIFIKPFLNSFRRRSAQFYRGWGGEVEIRRELRDLTDRFAVFQDVLLGEGKGNLDFVVVGPPGIFILEVKSHKGLVSHNGLTLTLNGRPFREKDLLKQAQGQMWSLKRYLKQQTGIDHIIRPVLVFSNPFTTMRFGYRPVSGVYVIKKESLLGLFYEFPPYQYPASQGEVEEVLLKTVEK